MYDFLVVNPEKRQLKVVIELKSQVGSFGNNFNNRTEEAMGAASTSGQLTGKGCLAQHLGHRG